jgi:hypothetical protein
MMETEGNHKKLRGRLREKIQLLESFSQATARMKDAIESKDIRGITLRVKERQGVINEIERIDKEVDKITQQDSFSIARSSEKAKDQVRSYSDKIKTTLESLADVDKKCLSLARAEHESLKSDILKVRQGFHVARGYRGVGCQNPRFLDMKK